MNFLRRPRTWLFALFALLVLFGTGALAVRAYLSSPSVARQAASQLQAQLGVPVEVGSARIGFSGQSTLHNVKLFEHGRNESSQPLLTIDDVEADISALGLLHGAHPQQLTAHGAHLTLRIDRHGKLLTRLPDFKGEGGGSLSSLRLDNSRLTIHQEGRPEMKLVGLVGELAPGANGPNLDGTITDPYWGDWTVALAFNRAKGEMTLRLDTKDADVTQAKLNAIPYVPPSVWEAVQAHGRTPVKVLVTFAPARPEDTHYRVDLSPRDTTVHVSSINLTATHAHGQVTVEDNLVELRDVAGRTADGKLATNADLDFRGKASHLKFDINARGVVVSKLPREWKVPEGIDGKLTGRADLDVTVAGRKVITKGNGKGVIDVTNVFGGKGQIELVLKSDGEKLRFAPVSMSRALVAFGIPVLMAFEAPPAKGPTPPPDLLTHGAHAVIRLPQTVGSAITTAANGTGHVLKRLGQIDRPLPPGKQPNYLDAKLSLEDIDVKQLVERVGVALPFPVAGKLSVRIQLGIPIDTPRDLKAYRFKGTADLARLKVGSLELTQTTARVDYANGVLRLEELSGQVPSGARVGTFVGHARVDIVPQGEISADLKIDGVPLDAILNALPDASGQAEGDLSGSVRFRAPVAKLSQPATWTGQASVRVGQLKAYGLEVRGAGADLTVDRGVATLKGIQGKVAGAPLSGGGTLQLKGDYSFEGKVSLKGLDLAASQRLAPDFRPPFPVEGTFQVSAAVSGSLSPMKIVGSGSVSAAGLVIDGVRADVISCKWDKKAGGIELRNIRARIYQGEVTGSALLPVESSAAGSIDLRIKGVDLQALSKALPGTPVRLEGLASGTMKGKLTPVMPGKARALASDLAVSAPTLRIQGIPAERLTGTVGYRNGLIEYRLQGETLGGKFKIEGKVPRRATVVPAAAPGEGARANPPDGRFQLEGARLGRLWAVLGAQSSLGPLKGTFSINLPFRNDGPAGRPTGTGRFALQDLRWEGAELADVLQGDLLLEEGTVQFNDVAGTLAGGSLRLRMVYNLANPRRSFFDVALTGADAKRLLVVVPGVGDEVQGALDVGLRGRIGPEWHGSGQVALSGGKVAGARISEWRIPIDFVLVPARGYGMLAIHDSGAQVGGGRAKVRGTVAWGGSGLRVEGNIVFIEAALGALLAGAGDVSSYAAGRINGTMVVAGSNVRSFNDLTADVRATLHQAQATQVPVLNAIVPLLFRGQANATFQSGEVRGRLAGGVFRVQRLSLVGTYLQMIAQGNITTQGRLDLELTARTGLFGPQSQGLRLLCLRLPAVGAVPVLLLVEATALLSNQVIHAHVNGTIRHPVTRIEPLRTITDEVARFFFLGRQT